MAKIRRLGPGTNLRKLTSGGGANFGVPAEWMRSMYGSGWPIQPISAPKDTELPRSIDYPVSVNATLVPRTSYGLMPFASLLEAYENVTECKMPVELIHRELTSFIPRLVDEDGNAVDDHPYAWMTKSPDGRTPFSVWMARFIKNAKVYDAAALYLERDDKQTRALHYVDGSTLFVIVDETGNIPKAERLSDYVRRYSQKPNSTRVPSGGISKGAPGNLQEFINRLAERLRGGQDIPDRIPAFTQVIKGTPFSWWDSEQIWYMPQSRRMNAPYGESFIESAWSWIMIIVNLTSFELGHYRTGNMPEGFMTLPTKDYESADRIMAAEEMFNARMSSNPATERMRLRMFPDGTKYFPTKKPDFPKELYSQAWKNILHTIGIPPAEFGDIPGGGLGGKGFKEGSASELGRNTLNPHRTFASDPFNTVLERDGVDDVKFELGYPIEEIDPDKQKQSAYDGMAHGTLTLNDALAELNLNPVGDPDDRDNIANKHLIVAGNSIFVIEDMVTQTGMAVPTFGGKPGGDTGGTPVGPETAAEQAGAEHTPEDHKTVERIIRNALENGKLDSKFFSIPTSTNGSTASTQVSKADATHSDSAMIAVMIPSDAAKQLRKLTEELGLPSDAQLELPENMHVTLAFLPDTKIARSASGNIMVAMQTVAQGHDVLDGKIQGYGIFNGKDGKKVLFALLDEPQLPFIRTAICKALDDSGIEYGTDYGFVPHITMAYFPESFELPAGFEVPNIPTRIEEISLCFDDECQTVPLGRITKLDKHCGLCPEDDEYFGAPISREVNFSFPAEHSHVNAVEIVAMWPDGLPPKPALWKPEGGEDASLAQWIGHPQYASEEAAYLLDRSLGFNLVPVAYVAESNGEYGAAIYYTFGAQPGGQMEQYAPQWVERAAVLDYIMSQADRHEPNHNYLTHPDDSTRPILIDNGLAFPADPDMGCDSPFCSAWLDKPLSEDVINALKLCIGDAATWRDIQKLVGSAATSKAQACAQWLLDHKALVAAETTSTLADTRGSSGQ